MCRMNLTPGEPLGSVLFVGGLALIVISTYIVQLCVFVEGTMLHSRQELFGAGPTFAFVLGGWCPLVARRDNDPAVLYSGLQQPLTWTRVSQPQHFGQNNSLW